MRAIAIDAALSQLGPGSPQWKPAAGSLFSYTEFTTFDVSLALSEAGVLSGNADFRAILDGSREGGLFYATLADIEAYLGIPSGGLADGGEYALLTRVTPQAAPGGQVIVTAGVSNGIGATNTVEGHGVQYNGSAWIGNRIGTTSNTPSTGSVGVDEVKGMTKCSNADGIGSGLFGKYLTVESAGGYKSSLSGAEVTGSHVVITVGCDATGAASVSVGQVKIELAAAKVGDTWL